MGSSTSTNDHAIRVVSGSVETYLPRLVQAVAFWAAVLLPFFALGLLASGIETATEGLALIGLLLTNVIALFVGHGYRR